ncbi:MAG: hypothetical protein AB1847_04530 [bacterium]
MYKRKLLTIGLFFALIWSIIFTGHVTLAASLAFDTFEYWDSPLNHGWQTSDPAYPVLGYNIGTGNLQTLVDFSEGSRVLQVNSTPSVFNQLQPYQIYNSNLINPQTGAAVNQKVISFKMHAPFAVEYFAMFQFCVVVVTTDDESKTLVYRPVEGPGPVQKGQDTIDVCLGRQYQDGTWHLVVRNMDDDIKAAIPGSGLKEVRAIIIRGNQYRVDDIIFYDDTQFINNHPPELWRIGPQFATLFAPFQLLIAARDQDGDFLNFVVTIGGYGAWGTNTSNVSFRIPQTPGDPNSPIAPDVVLMQFTPSVLEDLMVTVRVTDGLLSDVETFPLSVVTYPVAGMNHPPMLEELNAAVAQVGEPFVYDVLARDPDGDIITFSATIDDLPSYQFGPWSFNIINPITGQINFTPFFEGEYRLVVTVRDSRGMYAQGTIPLTVANAGTWLNHKPVLAQHVQNPQVARAGLPFTVPVEFVDPDGDKLYYSCTIGTVTERTDGKQGAVFSFFTNFPGIYLVKIIAYDDRGGLAEEMFAMDVQPWWTY